MAATISKIASQKNKIAAITETGFKNMPIADWWTKALYPALGGTNIRYLMVWGNYGTLPDTYWGTFKGQISANNFVSFSQKNKITFLSTLNKAAVYGTD